MFAEYSTSNGMSKGTIAGIAIAAAVMALGIIVIAFYALKQKKRADKGFEIHRIVPMLDNIKYQIISHFNE